MDDQAPDYSGRRKKDKNRKRGRKNQYYTQIDAEDDEEAEHLEGTAKEVVHEPKLDVIKEEEVKMKDRPKKLEKSMKNEKAKKEAEDAAKKAKDENEAKKLEDEIAMHQATLSPRKDLLHPGFKPSEEDPIVQVPPVAHKKTFNENDILGEFDRDEKGNIIVLQDKDGNFVDKLGRRVNERGYLLDPNTGNIIEKHLQQKMFEKNEIDERGEIPAPFCVEKHNFNPFKLRGDFNLDR